jgi:hypothetical protein
MGRYLDTDLPNASVQGSDDDRIVRVREHLAHLGISRCEAFESLMVDLLDYREREVEGMEE